VTTGPFGKPLSEERYVCLGEKYGATDYDYYLFANGEVWCFESSNRMFGAHSEWYQLTGDKLETKMGDGISVKEAAEAGRKELGL